MEKLFVFIGIPLLIILTIAGICGSIERNKWLKENCYEIGEISSSIGIGVGISTNGGAVPTTTFIPGKTGYQCNDGKQYWE